MRLQRVIHYLVTKHAHTWFFKAKLETGFKSNMKSLLKPYHKMSQFTALEMSLEESVLRTGVKVRV